jgi:hypothetical protein
MKRLISFCILLAIVAAVLLTSNDAFIVYDMY